MAEWLTLKDVHDRLGIAPNTIRKLIRSGDLRAYEIKGVRGPRFKEEDVEALITPIQPRPSKKVSRRGKTA